jgi:putative transposase
LTLTRESFEKIYRSEQDVKTKERMLLVLNVVYQRKVSAAQAARDLHRSKAWAWEWLKRYDKEGINGLKTRPKSGRPSKLSEEIEYRIKKELKESNQGWTTKQVEELIIKKSGIKYHYIHIYRILRKWGFKQKVPRKVHVNTSSKEEKEAFKKRLPRYLWISINNKSSKSSKSSSKKMALR